MPDPDDMRRLLEVVISVLKSLEPFSHGIDSTNIHHCIKATEQVLSELPQKARSWSENHTPTPIQQIALRFVEELLKKAGQQLIDEGVVKATAAKLQVTLPGGGNVLDFGVMEAD